MRLEELRGRPLVLAIFPASGSAAGSDQIALDKEILPEFHRLPFQLFGVLVGGAWRDVALSQERNVPFPLPAPFAPKSAVAPGHGWDCFAGGSGGEREVNEGLEQRVRERTRSLSEALERLEEVNRLKDEFLAMLGHELRNPLAAIANVAQILREEASREETGAGWALAMLERHIGNLSRIVDDLLDVSRIANGRIELRLQNADLGVIVAGAVETVRPQFEKKLHKLEVAHEQTEGELIDVDPVRLEQCLVNLLVNAAKYTPRKGAISIRSRRELGDMVIVVRDNGIGIKPEFLPKIFDLFVQAQHSLDRAEGGLGIGLNICRRLVELHHGQISAASAGMGHGTEVTIRLPISRENREHPGADTPMPSPRAGDGSRRVLVVDDHVDSANALAFLLEKRGFRTRVAHDGFDALRVALEFQPEMFLLDLGLPGIGGCDLAHRLRHAGFATAQLIAISGYAHENDVKEALAAGFDHHFAKPVELKALLSAMQVRDSLG